MSWLHAVFPIIGLLRCGRAASRLTEEVSSSPEPQVVPSVGMRRVGYVSGALACARSVCQSAFARLKHGVPAQKEWISVLGRFYSFHDGSTPASGTLCLSHGGRKSRCSVDVASASLRSADRRSAPPIASSAGGRTGIIPPLAAGGGEAKGGSRVRAAVCVTIAATRGFARFRAQATRCFSTGSGSESPPGWRQYTPGQVMRWGGVLIKP